MPRLQAYLNHCAGHTKNDAKDKSFEKPYRKNYIWKDYHEKGFWTVVGDGSDVFTGKHVTGWTSKVEPEALRYEEREAHFQQFGF